MSGWLQQGFWIGAAGHGQDSAHGAGQHGVINGAGQHGLTHGLGQHGATIGAAGQQGVAD